MAKLYLKFEQNGQVLKEVFLSLAATTIGRLPDNSVQIDNLAVSGHHARITWEKDHYIVEDLGSLNGTYVNNERVGKATLKNGDQVKIGKHLVEFKHESSVPNFAVAAVKAGPSAPKLDANKLLDEEAVAQAAKAALEATRSDRFTRQASLTDPYAQGPTADNQWIKMGPHVMVFVPDPKDLDAVTGTHASGEPYVMWKGTPYAHIMMPVPGNK